MELIGGQRRRRGKREFVQVLKLMENFRKEEVHEAVGNALRLGTLKLRRHQAPAPIQDRGSPP